MSAKIKCPQCGFEHEKREATAKDLVLCVEWAIQFLIDGKLPNQEQWDALQCLEYIPTYRKMRNSEEVFKLNHGHFGCAIDYAWKEIAMFIASTRMPKAVNIALATEATT